MLTICEAFNSIINNMIVIHMEPKGLFVDEQIDFRFAHV